MIYERITRIRDVSHRGKQNFLVPYYWTFIYYLLGNFVSFSCIKMIQKFGFENDKIPRMIRLAFYNSNTDEFSIEYIDSHIQIYHLLQRDFDEPFYSICRSDQHRLADNLWIIYDPDITMRERFYESRFGLQVTSGNLVFCCGRDDEEVISPFNGDIEEIKKLYYGRRAVLRDEEYEFIIL